MSRIVFKFRSKFVFHAFLGKECFLLRAELCSSKTSVFSAYTETPVNKKVPENA